MPWFMWREHLHGAPLIFGGVFTAFIGLFAFFAYAGFRAALAPANWLLRCNASGIWLKYRSYLNWRLPQEDTQVVAFDYSEVAWMRSVKERRTVPLLGGRNRSQIQVLHFLEFGLVDPDTSALDARLQAELQVKPENIMITLTYPVEVVSPGIVRVQWNGMSLWLSRAPAGAGRHVRVVGPDAVKSDLSYRKDLAPGDADARIAALVKSGDKIGAVKLTRQVYGASLDEAMVYVENAVAGLRPMRTHPIAQESFGLLMTRNGQRLANIGQRNCANPAQ